ncbi:MAG: NTP transferase domain-containing protein, partial [Desulfobulbaceae bacterium]|nr:NTP transferase domain-containing protein [Desulfobulbaceae bacterium]
KGELPSGLRNLPRIEDAPAIGGPLAGILSLLRWQPWCGWLVTATDQPFINTDALDWLLSQRRLGVHAVLPDLRGNGRVEPLLAYYAPRCHAMLEREAMVSPNPRPGCLRDGPGVLTPQPPEQLRDCWRNVNTPQEWALLRKSGML